MLVVWALALQAPGKYIGPSALTDTDANYFVCAFFFAYHFCFKTKIKKIKKKDANS